MPYAPRALWLLVTLAALSACSDDDKAERLRAAGPNPSPEALLRVAKPAAGARLFGRCAACHTIGQGAPNRAGPNLYGVVGRPVAAIPTFGYSHALKSAGGTWNPERLDTWLAAPAKFAPGTSMTFAGLGDPLDRADVIAYLQSQGVPR
ncbi:cytochrome c family protein [Sphingosinicella sp. BN140058]|uniref:c-type cytochrome n=1 Tax=Sphingosinicella sp. BN140058 TaxID=1892855 RepID=UPI0010132ED4|nr:cytochrome c family protein [Sphingosinicella sp. BN140058]QAY77529.1 cytochrome c family protein [Sphingosinicella sp. BN140058]